MALSRFWPWAVNDTDIYIKTKTVSGVFFI